jgi:hypothetical protein
MTTGAILVMQAFYITLSLMERLSRRTLSTWGVGETSAAEEM